MSFTEEELEKQAKEIRFNLLLVFIPIFVMLFIIGYYQSNSVDYVRIQYQNSQAVEFNGTIIKKAEEGDYSRATRYILLENYHKEPVSSEIYDKVNIGDSAVKRKGEDSVYYYLKIGAIIAKDYNKFEREEYQKAIKR